MNCLKLSLMPLVLCFFLSCGPVISSSVPIQSLAMQTVALLPIKSKIPVQREFLTQLHTALELALESKGYVIVNQNLSKSLCEFKEQSSTSCLYAADLSEQFGVDAFLQFELTSSRSTNLFLAKYKEVGGRLNILNPDLKQIASIESKVRVTGGALLSSGQLVEGLKSTLNDNNKDSLVYKMALEIASSLPSPRSQIGVLPDAFNRPVVSKVDVKRLGDARYQFCLASDGAKDEAFLKIDNYRAALSPISKGHYCGKYYLGDLVSPESQVSLVVYSVYGLRTEVELDQSVFAECSASQLQSALTGESCQSQSSQAKTLNCLSDFRACNISELSVFKKEASDDVYRQTSRIKSGALSAEHLLREKAGGEEVRLVFYSKNGSSSIPLNVGRK